MKHAAACGGNNCIYVSRLLRTVRFGCGRKGTLLLELWTAAWDALGTNSVVDDLQHAAVTAGPHARGHPPFVTKGNDQA
ncbi:hypothetical protein G5714_017914 [Onychostoma macrolepis]|uniref:Uncharacterized protein n=1 Tax=Onychostoma macrolepis TaxID=369639 RepID=A0A7J6C6M0_9TELE|nr:hypothetical protein G5714_017914 [Onychostoma macrolepis]